jgi:hypothetical protein
MFGSPLALVLAYRKISSPDDKNGEHIVMLHRPLLWNIMVVKLVLLWMLILDKILNTFRYIHMLCVCMCMHIPIHKHMHVCTHIHYLFICRCNLFHLLFKCCKTLCLQGC